MLHLQRRRYPNSRNQQAATCPVRHEGRSTDRQAILLAWKIPPLGPHGPFGSDTRSRGREPGVLTRHDHHASSRLRPSDDDQTLIFRILPPLAITDREVFTPRIRGCATIFYVASSRLRRVPANTAFSSRSSRPRSAIRTDSAAAVVPPGEVTFWRKTDASSPD
jgi:hypothetical protein